MVTLYPTKKRLKRVKYVEYDIHDINKIIYNDLENPIYKETKQIDWNINAVLEKGETAKLLDSNSGYHYITSFGRNSFLRYF